MHEIDVVTLIFQSLESCYPGGLTSHSTVQIPEHVSQEAGSFLQQVILVVLKKQLCQILDRLLHQHQIIWCITHLLHYTCVMHRIM